VLPRDAPAFQKSGPDDTVNSEGSNMSKADDSFVAGLTSGLAFRCTHPFRLI